MARLNRKKIDQSETHQDRWMVSYADFITLLFAFFVVMYSISSVNDAKYRSLTHSIGSAFSKTNQPGGSVDEPLALRPYSTVFQDLEPSTNEKFGSIMPAHPSQAASVSEEENEKKRKLSEEILQERKRLTDVSEQLHNALEPFVDINMVSVTSNDYWISLEMNSEMLFLSGAAELSKKSMPVLKKIAQVIAPMENAINVEGHTDDIPIANAKFRSNWDLSAARASTVVQAFVNMGIEPVRLSAIGYGEYHPISSNETEEGRFKNRRVILVLMSRAFSRYGANDAERAKLLNLAPTAPANDGFIAPP